MCSSELSKKSERIVDRSDEMRWNIVVIRSSLVIVMSMRFSSATLKIHYYQRMVLITDCTDFLTISISTHLPRSNKMRLFCALRKHEIWETVLLLPGQISGTDFLMKRAMRNFQPFFFVLFALLVLCLSLCFSFDDAVAFFNHDNGNSQRKLCHPCPLLSPAHFSPVCSVSEWSTVDNGFSAMPQMNKYTSND